MFGDLIAAIDRNTAALDRNTFVSMRLAREERIMTQKFDDAIARLTASVEREISVDASAAEAFRQLAEQFRANANDPTAIQALADKLDSSSTTLAAAIATNTPGAAAAVNEVQPPARATDTPVVAPGPPAGDPAAALPDAPPTDAPPAAQPAPTAIPDPAAKA